MRSVVWTAPAERDLEIIDDYWQVNNPVRADEILGHLESAGEFLAGMPHAGPFVDSLAARKWHVSTTSYVLIYRVADDRVEILRVHHWRQDWRPDDLPQ